MSTGRLFTLAQETAAGNLEISGMVTRARLIEKMQGGIEALETRSG